MDVAISIQKHIIRLYVAVDDALAMDISQRTAQLSDPEPHGFLGERLPGYVKA